MNSYDALAVLNQIADTNSRTEKEEILERVIGDPMMKQVVKYAYDPFVTFGLTPPKVETEGTLQFDADNRVVWGLLDALKDRAITGGSAQQHVLDTLLGLAPDAAELLWRILSKDLRCGITAKTVNKVLPGTIPTFDVMLAHKFEEKRIKAWPVAVEPKYDGVRNIALARDGAAQFFSRTGKPFPAVEHLGPHVVAMLDNARAALGTIEDEEKRALYREWLGGDEARLALDSEVVSGSFNKTVGDVRRKSESATDAELMVFEALPYEAFLNNDLNEIPINYAARRAFLDWVVKQAPKGAPIRTSNRYFANSHSEIMQFYENFQAAGLEGAMVKPLAGAYHKKRSHQWLKIKGEETEDLRIVGAFEGSGKYEGQLGGIIVDREGVQVRVGGGFSDQQRIEFWDAYNRGVENELIGRLIEVEYHEVTPDGSLRHPRFVRFRDDKDDRLKEAA
ncbi:DNA ligase-1 [Faunimonas pinastri]|uniref:DNA ligase-1 n=1 Tax=Faunimonas pinastri TaxID=1855383 RepID=A0A1H9MZS4_9HYPH|nr:hypothetical protein [Faunimonas pinastri]SER29230.1 DNA ligase-1 [Faunimonas pinastri]